MKEAREHAVLRVKVLREVVTAQFAVAEMPPVVEWVGVRVAANCVGQQRLAPVGVARAALGEEVHAVVFDQHGLALIGKRLGQHGPQIGDFESQGHG